MKTPWIFLALLVSLLVGLALAPSPSSAQLLVIDKKLVVTEVRPDHNKIGVTDPPLASETRNWVKIDSRTKISYKLRHIGRKELWRVLRRGMVVRVHGGRDWENNIVARDIWL